MASPSSEPDDGDPILEARVAHAIGPYAGLLPDDDLEALRDMTRRFLATHPVAAPLLDRLRPRAIPKASGETERRDTDALAAAAERLAAMAKAGAGGRRGGAT